ncbi:polyketide synthase [Penicillium psychrosexuale]|uniref:polyketide synthase n=1 Tax=Penicillium psychrosexuale TaxID=1002107 RepID=UPI0025454090|nr:polyketide synthase [Penicillium psychrosexuale]KAJ5791935.1 polyketide synthase [Penicillium psychrosexuale]
MLTGYCDVKLVQKTNRNATSRHYVQVGSITAAHFRGQAVSHDKQLDGMVTVGLGLGEVAQCPSTFEQDIKIADQLAGQS